MAEAKRRENWEHTSHILALIYAVNRSKKDKPLRPADFNPYVPKTKPKPALMMSIRDLRGVFFPGQQPTPPPPDKLIGGGKTSILSSGSVAGPVRSLGPLP